MTAPKILKRNDLANIMSMSFEYSNGIDAIDIPLNTSTVFSMRKISSGVLVVNRRAVSIASIVNGVVTVNFLWALGDTVLPGRYRAELEFDITNKPLTMPTVAYLNVLITEDVA